VVSLSAILPKKTSPEWMLSRLNEILAGVLRFAKQDEPWLIPEPPRVTGSTWNGGSPRINRESLGAPLSGLELHFVRRLRWTPRVPCAGMACL